MSETVRWSIILIGLAIAVAGAMGVFLPRGQRWAVLLPLLAGFGIGIVGIAIGSPDINETPSSNRYEDVFLLSSVAGFVAVAAGLAAVWLRRHEVGAGRSRDQGSLPATDTHS
jgi:drug/metabolite transporter (DMT)-like permease